MGAWCIDPRWQVDSRAPDVLRGQVDTRLILAAASQPVTTIRTVDWTAELAAERPTGSRGSSLG